MFSYSSASFSNTDDCKKCSLTAALEARLNELETCLHSLENPSVGQVV